MLQSNDVLLDMPMPAPPCFISTLPTPTHTFFPSNNLALCTLNISHTLHTSPHFAARQPPAHHVRQGQSVGLWKRPALRRQHRWCHGFGADGDAVLHVSGDVHRWGGGSETGRGGLCGVWGLGRQKGRGAEVVMGIDREDAPRPPSSYALLRHPQPPTFLPLTLRSALQAGPLTGSRGMCGRSASASSCLCSAGRRSAAQRHTRLVPYGQGHSGVERLLHHVAISMLLPPSY